MRFGKVVVVRRAGGRSPNGGVLWECRCDCGGELVKASDQVRKGSCHHCFPERVSIRVRLNPPPSQATHGHSRVGKIRPTYSTWRGMKYRCAPGGLYHDLGRYMCQRWTDKYENFLEDMGERPADKGSIDRIDNDGHYSCGHCEECVANGWPANCRWATSREQNRNVCYNVKITYQGRTLCAIDWAKETGINVGTIYSRVKSGLTPEEILSPKRRSGHPRRSPAHLGLRP